MKKITSIGLLFLAATPFIASAQQLQNIKNLILSVGNIVNILIPILIGVAILVFFWGLIKYIQASGKGQAEGRNIMIAGIVSIFVMVSLWGIIGFAGSAIGIGQNNGNGIQPPRVNGLQ